MSGDGERIQPIRPGVPFGGTTGQALVGVSGGMPTWSDTFATGKTIDLGSGALPAAVGLGHVLRIGNVDSTNNTIQADSFGGTALQFNGVAYGGTRGSKTATFAGQYFTAINGWGWDGSANGRGGWLGIFAPSTWTGTNRETSFVFYGTPNGSTTAAEWMRLQGGNLGIGVTPTAGNGLLQLPAGTTKANGIAAGTDTGWFRGAAGLWIHDALGTSNDPTLSIRRASGAQLDLFATAGNAYVGAASNHPLNLRTNNTDRIKIGAAGELHFSGGTPVAKPTLPAAATDAATTQALANAIRTALINNGLAA